MVPVTVFQTGGEYGVLPSDEIEADDDLEVVSEFFPWPAHEPALAVLACRLRAAARKGGFAAAGRPYS